MSKMFRQIISILLAKDIPYPPVEEMMTIILRKKGLNKK